MSAHKILENDLVLAEDAIKAALSDYKIKQQRK